MQFTRGMGPPPTYIAQTYIDTDNSNSELFIYITTYTNSELFRGKIMQINRGGGSTPTPHTLYKCMQIQIIQFQNCLFR